LREERETTGKSAVSQLWDVFSGNANAGGGTGDAAWLKGLVRKLEGSGDQEVSSAGAIGRYQVMPGTARQYGFDPSRLKDAKYNEQVADAILADLTKRYGGNTDEILAAYNAGPGRANKFHRTGDNINVLPWETQKYIRHGHSVPGYNPKVEVKIENAAGGTVITNTRQVAQ